MFRSILGLYERVRDYQEIFDIMVSDSKIKRPIVRMVSQHNDIWKKYCSNPRLSIDRFELEKLLEDSLDIVNGDEYDEGRVKEIKSRYKKIAGKIYWRSLVANFIWKEWQGKYGIIGPLAGAILGVIVLLSENVTLSVLLISTSIAITLIVRVIGSFPQIQRFKHLQDASVEIGDIYKEFEYSGKGKLNFNLTDRMHQFQSKYFISSDKGNSNSTTISPVMCWDALLFSDKFHNPAEIENVNAIKSEYKKLKYKYWRIWLVSVLFASTTRDK